MHSSKQLHALIDEINALLAKDRSSLPASGRRLLRQSRDVLVQIRDDPSSFTEEERKSKLADAAWAFARFVTNPDVFEGILEHADNLLS